ncbi:MAG: hypothetical protein AAGL68_11070 [Pseudomonadota bacterium]
MARFVRIASVGFAIFSVFFWSGVWMFVELVELLNERLTEATIWDRVAQAAPALIYGVITVLFCQWFARGVIKRAPQRDFD